MIHLQVTGMTCDHCVSAIDKVVKGIDSQADVNTDLEAGLVDIQSDLPADQFAQAIRDEGYGVSKR